MNKQEALVTLDEWVESPNLKKHMLAVAACMSFYARKFGQDEEKWWVAGLLHDLDYEKYPNPNRDESGHPYKVVEFLSAKGGSASGGKGKLDEESLGAIMGHAAFTHVLRESQMAKTLFAVDELTGMVVAVALVKPERKLSAVGIESVKKRFKEKRFAAGVNREEIIQGAQELGVPLDEHIQNVIDAMKGIASELGL
jgi:putative nucleotidyltransferase with HDIG domain